MIYKVDMSYNDAETVHDRETIIHLLEKEGKSVFAADGACCLIGFKGHQLAADIAYDDGEKLTKIFKGTIFVMDLDRPSPPDDLKILESKKFFERYGLG